ncbi:MAG: hypothetical protein JWQ14_1611 [Adhaeribacter sp.]|nr:hypothetical protein [Adhaeribacter sp.]
MEPEEIDKLFKDRLSGLPVMPTADAWARLQQKMEPPQKERNLWVYYVAASVVLLLVSGLFVYRNYAPGSAIKVAQTHIKRPAEINNPSLPDYQATPNLPAASITETETIAQLEPEPQKAEKEINVDFKKGAGDTKNEVKIAQGSSPKKVKKAALKITPPAAEQAVLKNNGALALQNKPGATTTNKNAIADTPEPVAGKVMQVLVKRDNADEYASITETDNADLRETISRKGALLKNIYKQARNLKNGEPVELAALGLDSEKIISERENIKQKLNKVISH